MRRGFPTIGGFNYKSALKDSSKAYLKSSRSWKGHESRPRLTSPIPDSTTPIRSLDQIRKWGSNSKQASPESGKSNQASAAVSFVLRQSGRGPEVLLLQRQIIERDPWSGQISFPGGRSKRGETLLETAKREAREEAGIDLDGCEIVGPMESVYPGNLSINVTPFVVIAPEDIVVKIDHTEIAEYFWAPLSYFSDKKNSAVYTFTRSERSIKVPSFVVSGKYVVWGMTLKIILNLLSELQR
jgi:8-oxo-dGTP pyrophosphatase MutT (NUDIX family)